MSPRHDLYTMENTAKGDRVQIDIPDETDPDHQYHGEHGVVVKILSDDAGEETGDSRDSRFYRIQLESGETIDVRWRDIRPPIE
jgi:hypothetical protein